MNKVLHYLEALSTTRCSLRDLTLNFETLIATFRLEYEEDYEYEFTVLNTRSYRLPGRKCSNCACSEL